MIVIVSTFLCFVNVTLIKILRIIILLMVNILL